MPELYRDGNKKNCVSMLLAQAKVRRIRREKKTNQTDENNDSEN